MGLYKMRLHDGMLWHVTTYGMQEGADEKLTWDLSSVIRFEGWFPFPLFFQNKILSDARSSQPACAELQMPWKAFTVQDFPHRPVHGVSLWDHSSQNSPCCFLQKLFFSICIILERWTQHKWSKILVYRIATCIGMKYLVVCKSSGISLKP